MLGAADRASTVNYALLLPGGNAAPGMVQDGHVP